jgi:hypothetical protein
MNSLDKLGIDIDLVFFRGQVEAFLQDHLNVSLISTLSNMLSLDYVLRVTEMQNITKEEYLKKSIRRLVIYLAGKFVEQKDFATAMNLFIVAISEEDVYSEDKDMLAEYIIENIVDDVSGEHKVKYKELIKTALIKDQQEIFDIINNQPQKLSQILLSTNNGIELLAGIKNANHDHQIANSQSVENKSLYSLIGSGLVAAIGVASASLLGGIAPFVIIPAAIFSLKMGAEAGEKVADKVHNSELKAPAFDKMFDKISLLIQQKIDMMIEGPAKNKNIEVKIPQAEIQKASQIIADISFHFGNEELLKPEKHLDIKKTKGRTL